MGYFDLVEQEEAIVLYCISISDTTGNAVLFTIVLNIISKVIDYASQDTYLYPNFGPMSPT